MNTEQCLCAGRVVNRSLMGRKQPPLFIHLVALTSSRDLVRDFGGRGDSGMTYLDAAYTILHAASEPLHYEDITQRALDRQLITPQGLTPAATMGSRLYTDTKQEGSRFVAAGHGRFGLAQWQPKGIEAHVQEINQATRGRLAELLHGHAAERFEALIGELLIAWALTRAASRSPSAAAMAESM